MTKLEDRAWGHGHHLLRRFPLPHWEERPTPATNPRTDATTPTIAAASKESRL